MLSFEQRIQMLIGAYTFQITSKEIELEQLKAENAELKAQLPEKPTEPLPKEDVE